MIKRFLIVEDDPHLLRIATLMFGSVFGQGAVDGVNCVQEALPLFKREAYALVVTDLGLPGISGVEFYRAALKVCASRNTALTPFIFCSGVRRALDRARDEFAGPRTRFFEKPFAMTRLLNEAESLIEATMRITS